MPVRRASASSRVILAAALTAAALGLSGCGTLFGDSAEDKELPYVERPVEELYADAYKQLERRNWEIAAKLFDEVERQHPYSVWARRAMLMSAYSYYQANKYNDAILATERFIQLHPGNKDAVYAYYLKAISYYEQIVDVSRDQSNTQKAMVALADVANRFPQSPYARDAQLKIDMTRDHLAGKEMTIGRYYLQQRQFIAAINRFRTVLENYQTTSHAPEALHRLTEAYLSLGIAGEAQAAAAVLGYNYPGSPWYEDSYALLTAQNLEPEASPDSWIARTVKSMF